MSRRQELEVGLKLQEREIERKQEGLVVLRDQLDAVKATNADLCNQLQVSVPDPTKLDNCQQHGGTARCFKSHDASSIMAAGRLLMTYG